MAEEEHSKDQESVIPNLANALENPEAPKKRERYQSQSGFIAVSLHRGYTEIGILDSNLQSEVGKSAFICGGYVRYCASPRRVPEPASDVDVYCKDEETFLHLKEFFKRIDLSVRHENDISLTYTLPKESTHPYFYAPAVQLIKPIREGRVVANGSMVEILENFDFTVIRCGLIDENTAMVDADFLHDEEHKELRLKTIHCPISSTLRCMKYARKGYWLRPFECLRLFLDWESRSEDYRNKLRNFLEKSAINGEFTKEEVNELEALMRID
jgi:hypothetical protein